MSDFGSLGRTMGANQAGLLKMVAAAFSALLIARIVLALSGGELSLALWSLLVTETLTFVLIIRARSPSRQAVTAKTIALTLIPVALMPFCDLSHGVELIPQPLPFIIVTLSLSLQVLAKMTIGRSFGLLPANRGIVDTGPYQLVRHPIYLSYLMQHVAFLLAMFDWWNLVLLVLVHSVQWFRLLEEERVLANDAGYRRYMERVPSRIIPGLV